MHMKLMINNKIFRLEFLQIVILVYFLSGGAARSDENNHRTFTIEVVTKLDLDYKNRPYEQLTFLLKNNGNESIWLPLPKSRLHAELSVERFFNYRAKINNSWNYDSLTKHEINYLFDWEILEPNETIQLWSVTIYKEHEKWEKVELSFSFKSENGEVERGILAWESSEKL